MKRKTRQWRPGGGLVKVWTIPARHLPQSVDAAAIEAECKRLRDELEWLGLNTVAACTVMPVYPKVQP